MEFITVDLDTMKFRLYTLDYSQELRGNTIEFDWVIDVAPPSTSKNVVISTFTIEFTGNNKVPYFDPPVGSIWQIFK